ncbi:TIGR01777 family oxidoreductase [Compostimonas suwonensis]|uniref:TIGR01777 family protein n=1 Tax=Compostimonas suwonensis TaxID=1048394 RepID=A0A2M9BTT7_9MICO|nr:TIGR01777 family oxidoreductase [Compostimonas suwonensis]PJJ61353.1 hypothetical protein CLV54_2297 [Compostimonas suwonensis]
MGGASGMIGTTLARALEEDGHEVTRLVRRAPQNDHEVNWAPSARMLDFTLIDRADVVVNLSGASLSHLPWTSSYRKQILESRVQATHALTDAMRMASSPPATFLSASAVGFYGDRPGSRLTEESAAGTGFLADLCQEWETVADLAPEKTRVVTLRTGLVLGPEGALKPLRTLTKLGVSGHLGTGGQHWPWISLLDEVAAIRHLVTSSLDGPVNLAGPTPATADRLMKRLASDLHRPYAFRIPERAMTLALGEAAHELLLSSQKVIPQKLLDDGFAFEHTTVDQAVDWAVSAR